MNTESRLLTVDLVVAASREPVTPLGDRLPAYLQPGVLRLS